MLALHYFCIMYKTAQMKNLHYILLLLLLASIPVDAPAQSVADVWKKMPAHIHVSIDSLARLDMIDLHRAGLKARARTLLGDTAQLITMGDTYMLLRTSQSSTLQIKCIKEKRRTIYAVITTVEGPAANSHINIYDEDWREISLKKYFKPLTAEDFIDASLDKQARADVAREIVVPTIQYTMNDTTSDITATPTFMQTLDKEVRERIKPHFLPEIKLRWSGKKWK